MKNTYIKTIVLILSFLFTQLNFAQNFREDRQEWQEFIADLEREEEEFWELESGSSGYNNYGWQKEFTSSYADYQQEEDNSEETKAYESAVGLVLGYINAVFPNGTTLNRDAFNGYILTAEKEKVQKVFTGQPYLSLDNDLTDLQKEAVEGIVGKDPFTFEVDIAFLNGETGAPSWHVPDFGDHVKFKNHTGTNNSHGIYEIDERSYFKYVYEQLISDDYFKSSNPNKNLTNENEQIEEIVKTVVEDHFKLGTHKEEDEDLSNELLSDSNKVSANIGIEIDKEFRKELETKLRTRYRSVADCILDESSIKRRPVNAQIRRNILFDVDGFELPSYINTCDEYITFEDRIVSRIYEASKGIQKINPTWPTHTVRTAALLEIAKKGVNECEILKHNEQKYPKLYTPSEISEVDNPFRPVMDHTTGKILNGVRGVNRGVNLKYFYTNPGTKFIPLNDRPFYDSDYNAVVHPLARFRGSGKTLKPKSQTTHPEAYLLTSEGYNSISRKNFTTSVASYMVARKEGQGVEYVRYLKKVIWKRSMLNATIQKIAVYGPAVPKTITPSSYTFSIKNADYGTANWDLVHKLALDGISFADLTGEDADYYIGSDNYLSDLEKPHTIDVCLNKSCTDVYNLNKLEKYRFDTYKALPRLSTTAGLASIKTAAERHSNETISREDTNHLSNTLNNVLTFGNTYSRTELARIINTLNEIHELKYNNQVISNSDTNKIIARISTIDLYQRLKNELDYKYPTNANEWKATLKVILHLEGLTLNSFVDNKADHISNQLSELNYRNTEDLWKIAATIAEWNTDIQTTNNIIQTRVISQIGQSVGKTFKLNIASAINRNEKSFNQVSNITKGLLVYNENGSGIVTLANQVESDPKTKLAVSDCKVATLTGALGNILAQGEDLSEFLEAMELRFRFTSSTSREKLQSIFDSALGKGAITMDEDGVVKLNISRESLSTEEQKAFFDLIEEATDPSNPDTVIRVYESDGAVVAGSFSAQKIDIDDIIMFEAGHLGANQMSILGHEIFEQFEKQANDMDRPASHSAAEALEEKLNGGYTRIDDDEFIGPEPFKVIDGGRTFFTRSGTGGFNYSNGETTINVKYIVEEGDIIQIIREEK